MTLEKMKEFIQRQRHTVLSSINIEGYPFSRVMTILKNTDCKEFYFLTRVVSLKYEHLKRQPKASLHFYDAATLESVNLTGTLEVFDDDEMKKMVWNKVTTLFIYRLDDTMKDYCLIKFTAKRARFFTKLTSYNFIIS